MAAFDDLYVAVGKAIEGLQRDARHELAAQLHTHRSEARSGKSSSAVTQLISLCELSDECSDDNCTKLAVNTVALKKFDGSTDPPLGACAEHMQLMLDAARSSDTSIQVVDSLAGRGSHAPPSD